MANTEIKNIVTADVAPAKKSLADLKKEVKDLKGELLNLTEGSEEYNMVLVEVADRQHRLEEVTRQVAASSRDFGDKMSAVAGTLAGVSGGVQVVASGLSLLGVEMGDDVKVLKTLQSLMALTSGIQAVDSGVKAFKALTVSLKATTLAQHGLNAAMKANPIGTVVAVITAAVAAASMLVAVFKKFGSKEVIDPLEQARNEMAKFNNELSKANDNSNFAIRLAEASGKSREEIRKLRMEQAKYNEELARSNFFRIQELYRSNPSEDMREQFKEAQKALKDAKKATLHLKQDFIIEDAKLDTEARRKAGEEWRKKYEDEKKMQKLINDTLAEMENERLDYEEEMLAERDENIEKHNEEWKQAEFDRWAEAFNMQQDAMESEEAFAEWRKQKEEEVVKARIEAQKVLVDSIASLMGSFADTLEEGTEEYKNLKAAEAIISTISGAVEAFMGVTASTGGWGIAAAAAQAAAVLAAGYAQVRNIYKVDTSGKATNATSTSMQVSTTAVNALSTNVTPVRQQSTQSDVANLPDTKVYVTIDDIERQSNRKKVVVTNATF